MEKLIDKYPVCPEYLTNSQKLEWHEFAQILTSYNLFTKANQNTLDMLAVNNEQYKDCMKKIQRMGLLIKGKDGQPATNPIWVMMNILEDKVHRCKKELGISADQIERREAAKWR